MLVCPIFKPKEKDIIRPIYLFSIPLFSSEIRQERENEPIFYIIHKKIFYFIDKSISRPNKNISPSDYLNLGEDEKKRCEIHFTGDTVIDGQVSVTTIQDVLAKFQEVKQYLIDEHEKYNIRLQLY